MSKKPKRHRKVGILTSEKISRAQPRERLEKRELVLVFKVKRIALRSPLSFASEPLEHTLLRCHGRVILTKPTIDNTTSMISILIFLQQSFLPLFRINVSLAQIE